MRIMNIINTLLEEASQATEKYKLLHDYNHQLEYKCIKNNAYIHYKNVHNLAESSQLISPALCNDIKSIQLNENYYITIVKIITRNNILS